MTTNSTSETYRDRLAEAAGRGGTALVDLIQGVTDVRERIALYTSARRVLVAGPALPGRLDAACEVAAAGASEVQGLLLTASDDDQRAALLRSLHILNFNLAADLCDCWPDDETPRERRHHEIGLRTSEYLLGGTFEGTVPARGLANDFWVRGMHQLSLGQAAAALESWRQAEAVSAANATGPEALEQLHLFRGYLAIAEWLTSDKRKRDAAARSYWEVQAELASHPEDGDSQYNLGQLDKVRRRYAPGLATEGISSEHGSRPE